MILCFVPYVYDLHIIKSVAEIPILKECSEDEQPLLLFISSSKKKNMQYYRKIARTLNKDRQKYKIDELNITSFHFNEITFNNELVNELWQMTIYYNQIPSAILPMSTDDNNLQIRFDQNSFTLNFLLAGRNGTGKSTFINLLKGRKIAYQSNLGIAKTNIINEYIITLHKKPSIDEEILDNNINNNINIINDNNLIEENSEISSILINEENEFHFNKEVNFSYQIADTMGFSEDNKESEKLLKYIKEYNEESARQKDRIHCIIYFIDDANRYRLGSSKVIINFFKFIVRKKIKIFFVINFNNGQKHECKKHLLLSLKKQLTESEFDFLFEEDRSNIIELSLRQNDNVKPFGLNKLMAKIESYFRKFHMEIINNELITPMSEKQSFKINNRTLNHYLEIMKQSNLFNDINKIDDLYIKFISKSKKLILYSIPIIIGISFIPIPGVDDAIAISIESGLIAAIGNCFGINMTKHEIKESFISVNFGSFKRVGILVSKVILRVAGLVIDILKLAPPLGTIIGGAASAGINVASIKLTGEQAISYFLDKFIREIDANYLINMFESYNNNIDGFNYLEEYFLFYEKDE